MHALMMFALVTVFSMLFVWEVSGAPAVKCEKQKTMAACEAINKCDWQRQGKSNNFKCRTLKVTPR